MHMQDTYNVYICIICFHIYIYVDIIHINASIKEDSQRPGPWNISLSTEACLRKSGPSPVGVGDAVAAFSGAVCWNDNLTVGCLRKKHVI